MNNQVFEIDKRYSINRKVPAAGVALNSQQPAAPRAPAPQIGAGAYGMVVSAVDEKTGKRVAIKKVRVRNSSRRPPVLPPAK